MKKSSDAKTLKRLEIERLLREKELTLFNQTLSRDGLKLIVVSGVEGVGKSSLLQLFLVEATSRGHRTAPEDLRGSLQVDKETTEKSFTRELAALLGVQPGDLVAATVDPPSDFPSNSSFPSTLARAAALKELESPANAESTPADNRRTDGAPPQPRNRSHGLIERIQSRSEKSEPPLLILIDEYDPSKEFDEWFKDYFLAELRSRGIAFTAAAAGETEKTQGLANQADLHLSLETPDAVIIRKTLDRISDLITPPLKADELERYIEELKTHPPLLRPLLRTLTLVGGAERV